MIELLAICVYSYFSDVSINASDLWCANFTSALTKVEGGGELVEHGLIQATNHEKGAHCTIQQTTATVHIGNVFMVWREARGGGGGGGGGGLGRHINRILSSR